MDGVGALAGEFGDLIARFIADVNVVAHTALHHVRASTAVERVVTPSAIDAVVAGAAVERVGSGIADQCIVQPVTGTVDIIGAGTDESYLVL